jgi:hypothetical protein
MGDRINHDEAPRVPYDEFPHGRMCASSNLVEAICYVPFHFSSLAVSCLVLVMVLGAMSDFYRVLLAAAVLVLELHHAILPFSS